MFQKREISRFSLILQSISSKTLIQLIQPASRFIRKLIGSWPPPPQADSTYINIFVFETRKAKIDDFEDFEEEKRLVLKEKFQHFKHV